MIKFMDHQSNRSTPLYEKSTKVELEVYLGKHYIDCLRDDLLQWRHKGESNKYSCISMLAKEFLSICASSSHSKHIFFTSKRIMTFRRRRLASDTISALTTLKSWDREHATEEDEIDSEVEESRFAK